MKAKLGAAAAALKWIERSWAVREQRGQSGISGKSAEIEPRALPRGEPAFKAGGWTCPESRTWPEIVAANSINLAADLRRVKRKGAIMESRRNS